MVLDHNSQLTLNACDLRQKNRMTLVEKKQKLIIDGIVRIHGLADVQFGEMLEFPGNTFGN
jgi:F0F1-type ATP synthase alpha subunit